MNVVITGATGMVGKGVLLVCLEDPGITRILSISRSSCGISHPKMKEILIADFFDLSAMELELKGYKICFFCLGVSAAGLDEQSYRKYTFELTLRFARTYLQINPGSQFCYVSGAGTDQSGRSRMMWARVKGQTEKGLGELGFDRVWFFRPGFIEPTRGVRSKTAWYQLFYTLLRPFYPVLRQFPRYVTTLDRLALAMIRVVREGYDRSVLESRDINNLANGSQLKTQQPIRKKLYI